MGRFDTVYDRTNTRSVKWDEIETIFQADDVLPMWVADMDFKVPQAVTDALMERVEHGIFGYTVIDEDVKKSITNWVKRRHDWDIQTEWLSFSPGVVKSLHIAIQVFTKPEDKVLVQTPVYNPFYTAIENHNRTIIRNPLIREGNTYKIDFEDFEEKIKEGVKAFILCSPHNPVGRVWTKEELEEMARICLKYDVLIISDDIHCDLLYPGQRHIPIASLSEAISKQTITCMSPTKTFNLAGLQASYMVTEDEEKREKIEAYLLKHGLKMLNTMGVSALEAAYNHGDEWLDELMQVLNDHKNYVKERFESEAKELKLIDAEGTYLLWVDCTDLGFTDDELVKFMIQDAKVGLNPGSNYGPEGEQFMRINIACPRATLEEGINRIINAVNNRHK